MPVSRRNLLISVGVGLAATALDVTAGTRYIATAAPRPATGSDAALPPGAGVSFGRSTLNQTILPYDAGTGGGYNLLTAGPGESHVVRTELTSQLTHISVGISAFAQLSDLHIVDDQSPLRVEFLDKYANAGPPH